MFNFILNEDEYIYKPGTNSNNVVVRPSGRPCIQKNHVTSKKNAREIDAKSRDPSFKKGNIKENKV